MDVNYKIRNLLKLLMNLTVAFIVLIKHYFIMIMTINKELVLSVDILVVNLYLIIALSQNLNRMEQLNYSVRLIILNLIFVILIVMIMQTLLFYRI